MDRTDLSHTDMRAEGLLAQPVELPVGKVLDVPLHIYDAGTKKYRETSTNDGLVLDVNCESACGEICAQMVD
jgi:hypothetical protein